ncbi:efflux RND transporter periplasmic adaptor subunit [Sphingomonas sp.]|uniref:efflux RND transporter periplasmic adaptor subunit n=1 Tax=Sphingomonas sp. TaxID=28214 RepID=UPI002C15937C|nr:efflux RND transporter periplasmic adaptor subunit [Sphingomonas sp.]HWK37006.1 efflux RND transporter periplasmic adaptor subunit [Sphingomonas sp.]
MNYETKMMGSDAGGGYAALPGEPPASRRRWLIIGAIVAIVIVVAVAAMVMRGGGAAGGDAAKGKSAASNNQIPTVTVSVPGRSTIRSMISGTGSLAAKREMPVGVAGEGGVVTRVLVEPGQWVGAGQVLATVDRSVQTQTAESLAAQIRVAKSEADIAQSNYERAQKLVSNGFVSKADLETKAATRDGALARVRVAEAALKETQARNRRLDIRAPAAGLILTRQVEPGQIVSSGSGTLFRMAMGGEMELRAQLSEADIQRLHAGIPASVMPVGSSKVFKGTIWQMSPVIDPQTRQGIARIQLAYDPALRPGGFASVTIAAGTTAAPQLPQSAVQSDTTGNYVYIVNARNEAERRNVTTGEVSDEGVAITSGLSGDERVVLTAGAFLNPGQKVIPTLLKKQ